MILTCPDCSTHYTVDAKTLGQSGRQVRCASCGHDWHAIPAPEQDSPVSDAMESHQEPAPDEQAGEVAQEEILTVSDDGGQDDTDAETAPDAAGANETADVDPQPAAKTTPAHRAYRNKLEARARRKRLLVGLGVWGGVATALVVIAALAILNRTSIVRMIPKTAGTFAAIGFAVNPWGVDLKDITSQRSRENGEDVLRISGQIYNAGDTPRPAPLVRISMRDETDEEIHAWTVPVDLATIPPKTGARFITVVRNPPAQAVDLRFSLTDTALPTEQKPHEQTQARQSSH